MIAFHLEEDTKGLRVDDVWVQRGVVIGVINDLSSTLMTVCMKFDIRHSWGTVFSGNFVVFSLTFC